MGELEIHYASKRSSSEVAGLQGDVRPRCYCSKPPIVYITRAQFSWEIFLSHCLRLCFFPLLSNGLILIETPFSNPLLTIFLRNPICLVWIIESATFVDPQVLCLPPFFLVGIKCARTKSYYKETDNLNISAFLSKSNQTHRGILHRCSAVDDTSREYPSLLLFLLLRERTLYRSRGGPRHRSNGSLLTEESGNNV